MTGTTVFGCLCDSLWGEPLLDPKKNFKINNFYIIDWIRKKLLVDVTNLATCWTNDYDILLEVLGTLGRIYVSRPVAKTSVLDWKSWLAQLFFGCLCDSFWGEPLLGPKKLQNQEFYMIDWIRKNSWSMLPIWLLAELNGYDILLEVLGTLGRIYVSRPVAKTLVLGWKSWLAQLFLDVFVTLCGVNPYWTQKKLQNQQFYIIDWIKKKLLVISSASSQIGNIDQEFLLYSIY